MVTQINISKYVAEVKKNLNIEVADDIIEKDLLLTLILAEFEKLNLGRSLIFKGGTLLSRNYLKYHRFSEDLDFVHKDSNELRLLKRAERERRIKQFIDSFIMELKKIADALGMDFNTSRKDQKYCTVIHARSVYIFRLYYSETRFIKIEINFIEKIINTPKEASVKAITDFFDSKELLFTLGLNVRNFKVPSYPLEEIILEKYRAALTRESLKERDIFDLFLIKSSLKVDTSQVVDKIRNSALIKRELEKTVSEKLTLLQDGKFFKSDEKIEDLAIIKYNKEGFEKFKTQLQPILTRICQEFLKK